MEQKKERSNTIDIVKAIMIISVVIYHLIYRQMHGMFDNIIREMIYLSMPLFFLFAGAFYKDDGDTFLKSLRKRLRKMLVMVLITTAVLLVLFGPYYILVYDEFTSKNWLGDILQTYLRPELMAIILPDMTGEQLFNNISPVWFIWALAFATMVFFAVMRVVKDDNKKMFISIAVLLIVGAVCQEMIPHFSWSIQLAPFYAGIMMIGLALRRYDALEKIKKINLGLSTVIMIVAGVIHYFIFMKLGSDCIYQSILGDHGYLSDLMFVVQIFFGGFVLVTLARIIDLSEYSKLAFAWVGRHTLVILIFHCLLGGIAMDIMHAYNKPGPYWYLDPLPTSVVVKSVISFVVGFGGCVALAVINDKLKAKYKKTK